MFDGLLRIFQRAHDEDDAPISTTGQRDITHKGQILKLLDRARAGRVMASLRPKGCTQTYGTSLLRFGPKNQSLIFDELNPFDGHERFVKAAGARVQTMVDGVDMIFDVELLEVDRQQGISFYRTALPTRVRYHQRRKNHRLRLNHTPYSLNLTFYSDNLQQAVIAPLFDISSGGIGMSADRRTDLQPGQKLTTCSLKLPTHEIVTFSLGVCHTEPEGTGKLFVGGNFQKLTSKAQNNIGRFITNLERETLRRADK